MKTDEILEKLAFRVINSSTNLDDNLHISEEDKKLLQNCYKKIEKLQRETERFKKQLNEILEILTIN